MRADQFRAWRKRLKLKQKDAAELLGLKKRMIQYYEKGHREGREVAIPKAVRLACYAIARGVGDFDGETPVRLDADASPDPAPPPTRASPRRGAAAGPDNAQVRPRRAPAPPRPAPVRSTE